jgi:hypothetical protein
MLKKSSILLPKTTFLTNLETPLLNKDPMSDFTWLNSNLPSNTTQSTKNGLFLTLLATLNALSVFAVLAMVIIPTIKVPSKSTQSLSFHSSADSQLLTESTKTTNDVNHQKKSPKNVTLMVFKKKTAKFGTKKVMIA